MHKQQLYNLREACFADGTNLSGVIVAIQSVIQSISRDYLSKDCAFVTLDQGHWAMPKTGVSPLTPLESAQGFAITTDELVMGYCLLLAQPNAPTASLESFIATAVPLSRVLLISKTTDAIVIQYWQGEWRHRTLFAKNSAVQHSADADALTTIGYLFEDVSKVVCTPQVLAQDLAAKARCLAENVEQVLLYEREKGNQLEQQDSDWAVSKDAKMGLNISLRQVYENFNQQLMNLEEQVEVHEQSHVTRRFADIYGQIITYGLVVARWMSRHQSGQFSLPNIKDLLPRSSDFLVQMLIDMLSVGDSAVVKLGIQELFSSLQRVAVLSVFSQHTNDPVIYFYEQFLTAYMPRLRQQNGVYYTPDEVVYHMVQTAHLQLQEQFSLALGLADETSWLDLYQQGLIDLPPNIEANSPFVQIVDPATGTGSFLVHIVQLVRQTMKRHWLEKGHRTDELVGLWADYLTKKDGFLRRLHAFEIMPAPYVIAHLRLGQLLADDEDMPFVFTANTGRLHLFLVNTLQSPKLVALSNEARHANIIKGKAAITVVIGNPPYRRLSAGKSKLTGWVREHLLPVYNEKTSAVGYGKDVKNTHNLYVYFLRWADWKLMSVAECGILSFITPSSFLHGNAFYGLRQYWRTIAAKLRIVDLEGNSRGFRVTDNVFHIQTPVAICTLVVKPSTAFDGRYRLVEGDRQQKLEFCKTKLIENDIGFYPMRGDKGDSFLVAMNSPYDDFPALVDFVPWQHSGCQYKRTWTIGQNQEMLERRLQKLIEEKDPEQKQLLFKENDRSVYTSQKNIYSGKADVPISELTTTQSLSANIKRYMYRAFDRSFCIADNRVCSRPRKELWRTASSLQIYFLSILKKVNTAGPAMVASALVPDLDALTSGGKDVVPLYRDAAATDVNINEAVYRKLMAAYGRHFPAEHVHYYLYAILSNPGFVTRFQVELRIPGIKIPVTQDYKLFQKAVHLGKSMIRIQTFGERLREPEDDFQLSGQAICANQLPMDVARYPTGFAYDEQRKVIMAKIRQERIDFIKNVSPNVYHFAISRFKPVQSWLGYRKKRKAGKSSTPLDDIRPKVWSPEMTQELIKVLHVLEMSHDCYPKLQHLLENILAGPLFTTADFSKPLASECTPQVPVLTGTGVT